MTQWAGLAQNGELWIFGYGSLMWRPGFPSDRAEHARIMGFRRCFCIYSTHHRGSADRPGLVLGLDKGGVCDGIAYRVPRDKVAETLAYLRAREQVNGVYRETLVPATFASGEHQHCLVRAYTVERAHPSYTGRLPIDVQARLVRAARGISGPNVDYLANTLAHLRSLGIFEPEIERVAVKVGALFTAFGRPHRSLSLRAQCARQPVIAPLLKPSERRRFIHRKQLAVLAERNLYATPEHAD